jgi:hypothetical protein
MYGAIGLAGSAYADGGQAFCSSAKEADFLNMGA